jgi:hypothetical protein
MSISSKFKQIFEGRILKELTVQASKIAEKAKDNASWSKSIPDAIGVGKAEKTATGYKVDVTVDLNKSPQAAAFEYGSGEHGEKGAKYPIRAKDPEQQPLHFFGKTWFIGPELPFGHPGVKARPYLQPAIESTRAGFVSSIAKAFKQSYLDSTVRVTVISAKK